MPIQLKYTTRMFVTATMVIGLFVMVAGQPGCSPRAAESEPMVHGPLDFDPTDEYELSRWWSNGRQLLRLDESGSYTIYPATNRYHALQERGRWHQPSYAYLVFQPYRRGTTDSRRISLDKINGQIAIILPGREPMFGIEQPPKVLEDRLIGAWSGPDGELSLTADQRYVFTPADEDGEPPLVRLSRHRGSWAIQGEVLVLQPDSPRLSSVAFRIDESDDDDTVLRSDDEELHSLHSKR